jgi:hypothetical protein
MKTEDIYVGSLNNERIAAYKELAKEYNLREGTVRDIFCKGAEWGIGITEREKRYSAHPNAYFSSVPNFPVNSCDAKGMPFGYHPIFPDKCDHPKERRTYYDGGSSWCNKCNCYVDIPPNLPKNEKRYIQYNDVWYQMGDKIQIGWLKLNYKIYYIGDSGDAIITRTGWLKRKKDKIITGNVKIEKVNEKVS